MHRDIGCRVTRIRRGIGTSDKKKNLANRFPKQRDHHTMTPLHISQNRAWTKPHSVLLSLAHKAQHQRNLVPGFWRGCRFLVPKPSASHLTSSFLEATAPMKAFNITFQKKNCDLMACKEKALKLFRMCCVCMCVCCKGVAETHSEAALVELNYLKKGSCIR